MRAHTLTVLCLIALTAGCYKATIETGLRPSGEMIKREWAHSFIAGLVSPTTIESAAKCPNGVARVQTQLSFLNMVANIVTFGIYTPMTIEVQCAAPRDGEEQLVVPVGSSSEAASRVIDAAAALSRAQDRGVLIRFE
jgi:hypothetical protein